MVQCEQRLRVLGTLLEVGVVIAERAKVKSLENIVFDRNGFKYHGRIASLADAVREAGLIK